MRKIAVSVMTGALALATALGLAATSGSSALASTGHRIEIHEIYYNPPGPDTRTNSQLNREWVQLHNRSDHRISLTGWTLRDKQGHIYKFGTYRINAHGYVKIHTGKGTNTQTDRYWGRSWYVWNNTGDQATVKDGSGNLIDQCSYSGGDTYKIC